MSDLKTLACRALALAKDKNITIVTAESCTAGKLTALLSEAPGAAERLHGSFVTYTKANKTRALGIPWPTLSLVEGSFVGCRGRVLKGVFPFIRCRPGC
jgi:nicotinamide mononucleotide (NMN) deamidase PncC